MRIRILLIIISLYIFGICNTLAIIRCYDNIIIGSDTLRLYSLPLESYPNKNIRSKIIKYLDDKYTAKYDLELEEEIEYCGGFISEWIIIDDVLYLQNILDCYDSDIKIDMDSLFSLDINNGMITADWYSGQLDIVKGQIIYNSIARPLFEENIVLTIDNGFVINRSHFQNQLVKLSKYNGNDFLMEKLVSKNINWSDLPDLDSNSVQTFLVIQPNFEGTIDSIEWGKSYQISYFPNKNSELLEGEKTPFLLETERISKLIADWNVIICRDKIEPQIFSILFRKSIVQ